MNAEKRKADAAAAATLAATFDKGRGIVGYFNSSVVGYNEEGVGLHACLSSAKLRSTDSVNPRAVLSRVRPRYRHLLQTP